MTDQTPTAYDEHIAEARAALGRRNNGGELPADIIAMAQVRATLALAEQARLSNLLAAQANNRAVLAGFPHMLHAPHMSERAGYISQQIREALGGPVIPDPREELDPEEQDRRAAELADRLFPGGRDQAATPEPTPVHTHEVGDDCLTEDERKEVEALTIGKHHELTGDRLAYRLWMLRDIAGDRNEDEGTIALALVELATYPTEEAGA